MPDNSTELPDYAKNAPWRFRPILLAMVDMRDWLFRYSAINLLWFVLSLTIILLPPATIGLYHVAWHTYYNREPSLKLYIAGMKRYFWQSYIWAFFMLITLSMGFSALLYYTTHEIFIGIVFSVVVTVLLLGGLFHYLPYLVLEKHAFKALKLSVFTALADPFTILIYALLMFIFGIPSIIVVAPLMFILPIILALIGMYNLLNWLYNYDRMEGQIREI